MKPAEGWKLVLTIETPWVLTGFDSKHLDGQVFKQREAVVDDMNPKAWCFVYDKASVKPHFRTAYMRPAKAMLLRAASGRYDEFALPE